MATKPMVGARVPQEWADEIGQIASEKGIKPSQIVYEAIATYLDRDSLATVATHEARIAALEDRLGRLAK